MSSMSQLMGMFEKTGGNFIITMGGSTFTTTDGRTYDIGGKKKIITQDSITMKFNRILDKNDEKEVWELYQSNINCELISKNLQLTSRVKEIKNSLTKLDDNFKILIKCPSEIEESPSRCFEIAVKLQSIVKKYLLNIVNRDRKFKIHQNTFDKELDHAERHTVEIFVELIQYYNRKN